MTPEQQQALIEASAPLVENPTPWRDLPSELKDLFLLLMPEPTFSAAQSYWIRFWWLPVDEQIVDALNALAPPNNVLMGRADVNGDLWLSCDLLTDSIGNGRLFAMFDILETLPITYKAEEDWPVPEQVET
jgi:hypothetical protein